MSALPSVPTRAERLSRALAALRGLAVGDALGSQFFVPANLTYLRRRREPPPGNWQWTDDTEMAASVVAVLAAHGRTDQDALAASFALRHDFDRGYGPAVNRMLRLIRQEGGDWRELAASLFDGQGSWGNGGAMGSPRWVPGSPTIRSGRQTKPYAPPRSPTGTPRLSRVPGPSRRRLLSSPLRNTVLPRCRKASAAVPAPTRQGRRTRTAANPHPHRLR